MLSEILLLFVGLFFLYQWLRPKIPPNFPPGPPNYPILGGVSILKKLDPLTGNALVKLGDMYGPVTGLYFGSSLGIAVNGFENVMEVLTQEEFNGRPRAVLDIKGLPTEKGIMFNDGDSWKEQRRFALRHLRDLGFGKSSLEVLIHDEINELIEILNKSIKLSEKNKGIALESIFGVSIVNVLWLVVGGKRFKHDDEEFKEILVQLTNSFRSGNPASNLVGEYPWLRFFPYFSGIYKGLVEGRLSTFNLLKNTVEKHKAARKSNQNSADFIDSYLDELDKLKESGSDPTSFNENQLVKVCSDLFIAGAESTSNSLAFAMLHMLLYPEIQTKVQKEIDAVVPKDRLPSLDDRSKLPYTEAVLDELLRMTGIAPLTVPHWTHRDTTLNGYSIPNNTLVLVNLHSVHMDKTYWGDPEVFRPERFIDSSGKFAKSERVIPFGHGKRLCPGESLARMNYYLFFTAMTQKFRLELVQGEPVPSKVPNDGFTIAPQPFKAILVPRN